VKFLGRLLLGTGRLEPELRAELEAEGLVLVEEGLGGSVRYRHFRAPGKRFHGKITLERMAIGISQKRVVVYCRSGRVKLIDSDFANRRWEWVDVTAEDDGHAVHFLVDYDRQTEDPKVAGQITIRAKTPRATEIVTQLHGRLRRR